MLRSIRRADQENEFRVLGYYMNIVMMLTRIVFSPCIQD